LRRAVALDPHLGDPPFTLGVLLWQTGRAAEAEQLFKEAIKRNKDSADAHYMLGTLLKTSGRADEALAEFREAVRLRPDSVEAHQSLAQVLQQKGDGPGANAAHREADRLARRKADGQASTFAVSVGRQKLKSGDRAAAIAHFREAIKLAPDNAEAHHALALALQQTGAVAEARQHFEQAHKLAPYLYPREDRQ
jgi:protein O-GlcNAc transferase